MELYIAPVLSQCSAARNRHDLWRTFSLDPKASRRCRGIDNRPSFQNLRAKAGILVAWLVQIWPHVIAAVPLGPSLHFVYLGVEVVDILWHFPGLSGEVWLI